MFGTEIYYGDGAPKVIAIINSIISNHCYLPRTCLKYSYFCISVKDPCSGDSGGPLMIQDHETARWTIIGSFLILQVLHSRAKTKSNPGTVQGSGWDCVRDEPVIFDG